MELYNGCCEFCGQVVEYEGKILKEAKWNRRAAAKIACDCPQAKHYRHKRDNIQRGIRRVEAVAGGESPVSKEVLSEMKRAVVNITERKMEQMTIKINNREKVEVKLTSKGIKVSREIKKKEDSEVEMII